MKLVHFFKTKVLANLNWLGAMLTIKTTTGTLIVLLFMAGLYSCNLEGSCEQQAEAFVKELIMPDSAPINTEIDIQVKYLLYNSCGKFNKFYSSVNSDTTSIRVHVDYIGCDCPNVLPDSIAIYKFTGRAKRQYFFRAVGVDGIVFQDTLTCY